MAAGIALLLSIASIAWQVVTWRRAGPKLVVEAGRAFIVGSSYVSALTVRFTNIGRAATTVTRVYFKEVDGSRLIGLENLDPEHGSGPHVPLRVEPEASATFTLSIQAARRALVSERPGDEIWLRAVVRYGNRQALSGRRRRKLIYLRHDPDHGKPMGRWARFHRNLRPSWFSMMGGFVPDGRGQLTDRFAITVQNLGWLPFWRLRVFAASEQLQQMSVDERQVLERAAYRRLLLFRWQTWYLEVPDELQELAGRHPIVFRRAGSLGGVGVPDRRTVEEARQMVRANGRVVGSSPPVKRADAT